MDLDIREFEFEELDDLITNLNLILEFYNVSTKFSVLHKKTTDHRISRKANWNRFIKFGQKEAFRIYFYTNLEEELFVVFDTALCNLISGNLYHVFTDKISDKGKKNDATNKIHSAFCKFYNKSKKIIEIDGFEYVMMPDNDPAYTKFKCKQKCPTNLFWKLTIV